ncbi:hypothetical protein HOBO_147 [Bacillus phage Hobo]|uniref:Uncharacterized protein n=2 Tax=Caeruleovirus BM15 TaxID=1985178 RepID=A0A0S2MUM9_9CAUD|nr:hypothetical protein FD732_gp195 [Bacillus phage BM15]ALO79554.1 hypothetical protein BM10_150 [Bacillus phage BM15]AXQ66905.1 hypothetical protein HOBO_147 [Bacillus phage Hobo]
MLEGIKKAFFGETGEEVQAPVEVNPIDDAVAAKLGLKVAEGQYKDVQINLETGEVFLLEEVIVDTPPEFSKDRFLVNMMADFANENNVVLPKWTAEPLKIAKAIADWEPQN